MVGIKQGKPKCGCILVEPWGPSFFEKREKWTCQLPDNVHMEGTIVGLNNIFLILLRVGDKW